MGQGAVQREGEDVDRPRARVHHHGVRGSAALPTRRLSPGAVAAEALEPGEMRRVPFGGELLGAARVRSRFVPVPLDAFDEAAPALAPEAQAAYFHLLRLSYGEGRNHCRAPKRELLARLHLSERRLLRVLDALVARGLARPLHRDNRGTLWRVYLPREAAGQEVGDDVLLGRAAPAAPRRAPAPAPIPGGPRARPEPPRAAAPAAPVAALARELAAARGELDASGLERAASEVRELLAEGQPPARIAAAIETVRRRGPGRASSEGGSP